MSERALKLIAENKAKHARGEDARVLDLRSCRLIEVPDEVDDLVWLEELILSNDNSMLEDFFNNLVKGVIRLIFNRVKILIEALSILMSKKTQLIIYGENEIESVKRTFYNLTQLKKLHLNGLPIRNLNGIERLINLEYLDISRTYVKTLTPIAKLTNLRHLDCSGVKNLTNLTPLKNLINLEYLDISRKGRDFPWDEDDLDMFGLPFGINPVKDLAPICKLYNIKHLNVSHTRVCDLIPICKLTNLENLNVSNTEVSDLMPICKLTNLENLNVSNTAVSDLIPINGLVNLKHLDCSRTSICDLTPLKSLINLEYLNFLFCFDVNSLQPISNLINLKTLYCAGDGISDLTPLSSLIKNGLPIQIGKKYQRDFLFLDGGINIEHLKPQKLKPPIEIIQRGREVILKYLEELEIKETFKNTEVKLILLGNSTAGKTSLSQFLRNRTFIKEQPTTHGILNQKWQLKDSEMQVNVWDFGGQEYYHATHRLFLSRNSVYVLLWDKQTDKGGYCETPIYFDNDPKPTILQLEHFSRKWWVQNIKRYTYESNPPVPILLVQNKCARDGIERVSSEFENPPFNLLPEWLDNHIDLKAAADLEHTQHKKWLRQFETVEERLLDKLQNQLTHYKFAVYHREIRDEVRRLASEGVTDLLYSDFEALCRRFDPEAEMVLVEIYLRDISGDILYYPNNKRLSKWVFLRPDWVCERIYQILSRKVKEQHGLFDLNRVQEALNCNEEEAFDFVELMREFELVFEYPKENESVERQWVAPQYLPENCAKQEELSATKKRMKLEHGFTLYFPEFLPKSHIARFVSNWGDKAKDRLFWKNGLLFETKECTVLVERIEGHRIQVEIQPYHPRQKEVVFDVFQSFLHLEEGNIGFAVSFDRENFVRWRDVEREVQKQSPKVEVIGDKNKLPISIRPFLIFIQSDTRPEPEALFSKNNFSSYNLDNESKERVLVGEVTTIVASAGQIIREQTVGDHGIDMQIEFKNDKNEATGQYLFLQLKSGDSYLKPRKDGTEIFEIPKERHVDYWKNHHGNVMLVIRRSNGEILWMEIKEYLKNEVEAGKRPKRIIFKGEPFTPDSVLAWRKQILEKIK